VTLRRLDRPSTGPHLHFEILENGRPTTRWQPWRCAASSSPATSVALKKQVDRDLAGARAGGGLDLTRMAPRRPKRCVRQARIRRSKGTSPPSAPRLVVIPCLPSTNNGSRRSVARR